MASHALLSPAMTIDETPNAPSAMGTTAYSSTAPNPTASATSNRNEITYAMTATKAAASVATTTALVDDVAEEEKSIELEEEEAGNNEGAASNPTHNWGCSVVHDQELKEMAKDGAIPPSSASAWRDGLDDPFPTQIQGERVLLASHIVRGFSLPHSDFLPEVLDHYGLQLHNITPNSVLYVAGFVSLFEGYLGIVQG